ncbi:cytochrome C oxidase subunit II [Ornithinibacillus sp. L9]|uniref:Cytochrome C oxidase subunit II n=1 Tax=Ornithinibacillus caprae TaxID=2678566 RepID=A0A6N8FKM4_9BACI|nr:cytochrome C oxidase subunit II [Ornithinibacillus caprae]
MKKGLLVTILFSFILILAACGGNDVDQEASNTSNESSSTNQLVDLTATNFEFDQAEYTVNAGEEVKITLTNEEGMHGISIDEFDVNIEGEGEATFTPDEPGEYTIYCSIPCGQGHSEMTAKLIVK